MGGHAAPWPPGFGDLCKGLGIGTLAKAEGDACRFLNRQVAGRKCVGMTEAKEQVDIRRPGPNSVQGDEGRMRLICIHIADRGQIDASLGDGLRDLTD